MRDYQILLVDDDPILLAGIAKDLETEGYKVTTAINGEKAFALINRQHFDLVITDLVMGNIDGIQVLERVKDKNPETMVIILTGYGDMASAISALRHHADDYMLKPSDSEEFRYRVSRCFEQLEQSRKIKVYEKMLPICCECKKIRDDAGKEPGTGSWISVEDFVWTKMRLSPTSTYCPDCVAKVKAEMNRVDGIEE
ncbi:MAG: response regulator [Desulfobacteraceae bacterium]|nr:response regulator [Desulfobacteraceae bacterium]